MFQFKNNHTQTRTLTPGLTNGTDICAEHAHYASTVSQDPTRTNTTKALFTDIQVWHTSIHLNYRSYFVVRVDTVKPGFTVCIPASCIDSLHGRPLKILTINLRYDVHLKQPIRFQLHDSLPVEVNACNTNSAHPSCGWQWIEVNWQQSFHPDREWERIQRAGVTELAHFCSSPSWCLTLQGLATNVTEWQKKTNNKITIACGMTFLWFWEYLFIPC